MSGGEAARWREVRAMFAEALELDDDGRAALFARLRGSDPALADELDGLLAAHAGAGDFLGRPRLRLLPDPAAESSADEPPRTSLGPYSLVGVLGRGGMGTVYRAVRADGAFHREVAIKLLRRGLETPELLSRFHGERQILADLDHPNVARLLDGGTTRDGLPYLVLEYVEGEPIDAWCRRRALSLDDRLRLFVKVCRAVHFAHQNLVVHRDLKPANLLVREDGEPKLLDFGIAKLLPWDRPGRSTATTLPDSRPLTLAYASPEQALGRPVTTQSDVYSLGVVLYELLAGCRPLDLEAASLAEMLRHLEETEPAPPSRAARRREAAAALGLRAGAEAGWSRRLRGDLDRVGLTALAKEPCRRYASAAELADELQRVLDGDPVKARGTSLGYRTGKWLRKHRLAAGLAAGAVALVVSLLAALAIQQWNAARLAGFAQRYGQEGQEMESLSRSVAMLPLQDVRPWRAELRQRLTTLETEVAAEGGLAEGPASYALGRGHLALGEYEAARRHLEMAWNKGFTNGQVAHALGLTLSALYRQALLDAERLPDAAARAEHIAAASAELRDPALRHLRRADGLQPPQRLLVEGLIALADRRLDDARDLGRRAAQRAPWLYQAKLLEGDASLLQAIAAAREGRVDEVEELYRTAGEAYAAGLAVAPSDVELRTAECRRLQSLVEHQLGAGPLTEDGGDDVAAVEACKLAVLVDPERAEPHRLLGFVHSRIGWNRMAHRQRPLDDFRAAVFELRRAVDLDPDDFLALQRLGSTVSFVLGWYWSVGRPPEPELLAEAHWTTHRALELHPRSSSALNGAASLWLREGQMADAQGLDPDGAWARSAALYRRALEIEPTSCDLAYNLGFLGSLESESALRRGLAVEARTRRALDYIEEVCRRCPDRMLAHSVAGTLYVTWALDRMLRGLDPSEQTGLALEHSRRSLETDPSLSAGNGIAMWAHLTQAQWLSRHGEPAAEPLAAARSQGERLAQLNGTAVGLARTLVASGRERWRRGLSPANDFIRSRQVVTRAAQGRQLTLVERMRLADAYLFEARWRRETGREGVAELVTQGLAAVAEGVGTGSGNNERSALEASLRLLVAAPGSAEAEAARRQLDASLGAAPLLRLRYGGEAPGA